MVRVNFVNSRKLMDICWINEETNKLEGTVDVYLKMGKIIIWDVLCFIKCY